jgi:pimeloyl-ACP methyl ester carboxylesterase
MAPPSLPFLLAMAACVPKYSTQKPIDPQELWAPLPVQHVTVDGVDVAYIDNGRSSAQPPLVFIHGLSSYMGFWEHQIPAVGGERRVLALDLPGFGASGRPDAPYTPPWYASIVVHWLDALGVEKAVLVGHSMGGQISMTIALEHPEKVDRLVLAAPAGIETFSPGSARWMKDYWHESRALEAREDELRATFETLVFNRKDAGVERMLAERVRMRHTPAFRGTSVAVSRAVAGMLDHPVAARLPQIQAPTLIIYGSADHMIPNPVFNGGSTRSVGEAGRRAIPGAQLLMIPGAGHTVQHDAPDEFNAALTRFIGG